MLEKFMQIPLIQKIFIMVLVLLIVAAGYWSLFYSSINDAINKSNADKAALMAQLQELEQYQIKLDITKMEKEFKQMQKEIDGIKKKLPQQLEVDSFISALKTEADGVGLSIESFKPTDPVPGGEFLRIPVEMKVVGNYPQILQYFKLLAKMIDRPHSGRIVNITQLKIKPITQRNVQMDSASGGNLEAEFVATTFSAK